MSFTFRFLTSADPYYPRWSDLRRRVRWNWVAWAAWMPFVVVTTLLVESVFGPRWEMWPALAGAAVLAVLHLYRANWACPRCGQPFYRTWYMYWPVANQCLHCGLPENAPDADAGADKVLLPSCSTTTSP